MTYEEVGGLDVQSRTDRPRPTDALARVFACSGMHARRRRKRRLSELIGWQLA